MVLSASADSFPATPPSRFQPALESLLRKEALPVEKFGHQPRLYALTRLIGTGCEYDEDIVCAAAYLHDLGVFQGHRPENPELLSRWDNVAYALEKSPAVLRSIDFPEFKILPVLAAIETHQPQHQPRTLEAAILRDADILEQLGAIGILRTVAKVGRDTRFPTFTPAVAALENALRVLPRTILLPTTQALAQPRIMVLRAFLAAVQDEASDRLY